MVKDKLKVLFACTVNRRRSATAHKIFDQDERFEVISAGTDPHANCVLSLDHLLWADAIVVMAAGMGDYSITVKEYLWRPDENGVMKTSRKKEAAPCSWMGADAASFKLDQNNC